MPRWVLERTGVREEEIEKKVLEGEAISISFPLILPHTKKAHRIVITNVYRPTDEAEQPDFDERLNEMLGGWGFGEGDVHFGLGDFNGCVSKMDQMSGVGAKINLGLEALTDRWGWVDSVREIHGAKRLATRRWDVRGEDTPITTPRATLRRLDYVFHSAPAGFGVKTLGARFVPSRSDHHMVVVAFEGILPSEPKQEITRIPLGPLERDEKEWDIVLENKWKEALEKCATIWGAWETWKREVGGLLLESEKKYRKNQPEKPLECATAGIAGMIEEFGERGEMGEEWEEMLGEFESATELSASIQKKGKKQWLDRHWNAGTREFYAAIRPPTQGTYVPSSKYVTPSGKVVKSEGGKQHLPFAAYYQDLSAPVEPKSVAYWARHMPLLGEFEAAKLDAKFGDAEIDGAIKDLAANKSHGVDGFSGELYQRLWGFPWSRVAFGEVMNGTYKAGYTPSSWGKMVVVVIYKKGDPENVKNYRPIAVTGINYKLQSRMLATRLQRPLGGMISEEQVGFMEGRLIHENIGIVQGVLEAGEGSVHFSDFAAAFPSVPHGFITQLLYLLKFPPRFTKMIAAYHTGLTAQIKVNGGVGGKFQMRRGVKQGCPLAPLLFNLVIQCYILELKQQLKGIEVGGVAFKVRAFADDCVYFTRDEEDLEVLGRIMRQWEHASGMSFAPAKSFSIGTQRRVLGPEEAPIVSGGAFTRLGAEGAPTEARYLGWLLGVNQYRADRISWEESFVKAEVRIRYMARYRFSLPQRLRVLRATVVSLFTYKTYFLLPTREEEARFERMVRRMLWGTGASKVSWGASQAALMEGGLEVMGLGELCECFQAALVGRLEASKGPSACMRGWVAASQRAAGLPVGDWQDADLNGMPRDSWVINGLIKARDIQGGLSEELVTLTPGSIAATPFWGGAQFAGGVRELSPVDRQTVRERGYKVEDVVDELGGPIIALREKRKGVPMKQALMNQLYHMIPDQWIKVLREGLGGEGFRLRNPPGAITEVWRVKQLSMAKRPDPLEAKWGETAKGRSREFLRDLKFAAAPLSW